MGEVHATMQDSKDAKDFVKRMKKEMPRVAKKMTDRELEDFYTQLKAEDEK